MSPGCLSIPVCTVVRVLIQACIHGLSWSSSLITHATAILRHVHVGLWHSSAHRRLPRPWCTHTTVLGLGQDPELRIQRHLILRSTAFNFSLELFSCLVLLL